MGETTESERDEHGGASEFGTVSRMDPQIAKILEVHKFPNFEIWRWHDSNGIFFEHSAAFVTECGEL